MSEIDKRENYIETSCNEFSYTTKNNRSIISYLKEYQFPDDIKYRANFIYSKMTLSIRRQNNRKFLLFFCVYSAYKELNINVNPSDLAKIFKLKDGETKRTLTMFGPLKTGYKPVQRVISPSDYLVDFCIQLDMEQYTDELFNFSQSLLENHKELLQFVSQTVAAGILMYFMIMNGIESIDKKLLPEVTNRSETTIIAMYKRICELETN